MTATIGHVNEFNPNNDSFATYVERVNIFFTMNEIKTEKRAAVFLNLIGAKAYDLLCSLLTPTLPQSLKYEELVDVLKAHYEPKPLVIAERFHFHRCNQRDGESIAEYMAELRRLSTHCEFKTTDQSVTEVSRDRLVCGLHSESRQRHLLAEKDLSLQKAMELAQGMEAAELNAKSLKSQERAVNKLQIRRTGFRRPGPTPTPCHPCGSSNHDQKDCRFRDAECNFCHKKGHIATVCRAKLGTRHNLSPKRPGRTQYVEVSTA